MNYGKITINQILFTFILAGLAALWGINTGLDRKEKEMEQKINALVDTMEKKHWDIEVKKMEDAQIVTPKWEVIKMDVSAYCPCEKCCGQFADGITASGHKIKSGDVFVAAPRKYPFGTEMRIEGYAGGNTVKVEDVGGAIKGNKLDLFFHSHQEALNHGRKDIMVMVKIQPEK